MTRAHRSWVPDPCETRVRTITAATEARSDAQIFERLTELVKDNREIHEQECFNLNPATNVMNPRAEALLRYSTFALSKSVWRRVRWPIFMRS